MGHPRRSKFRRIEELITSREGIDYPDQFVNYGYHGFFIASELSVFPSEVMLKSFLPLDRSYGHLEEDISKVRISLFGDVHTDLPFSGLFDHGICSGIFDQFFGVTEAFYVFDFGQEPGGEVAGDAFYGGEAFQLSFHGSFDLRLEVFFQFFDHGLEEEDLLDVNLEDFFQAFMRDSHGVLGHLHEVLSGEGRFTARQSGEDIVYFSPTGFGNSFSGGVAAEDFKEGPREDIEVFFSFGEKGGEGVFDLGFGLGDFLFEFLDLSGQEFGFGGEGSWFKEVGIGEGKERQEEGVFFIGLRGVVSGDEPDEVMNHFRVEEGYLEVLVQEEGEEREVEASGGFKDDMVWGIGGESLEEVFEAFGRHGEVFGYELSLLWVKDTELEGIFGDIDTYVEHRLPPGIRYMSLSSILPFGRGFCAQPTNWELRDRGTDSYRGFQAYEKWSPCPSINFISGIDIT